MRRTLIAAALATGCWTAPLWAQPAPEGNRPAPPTPPKPPASENRSDAPEKPERPERPDRPDRPRPPAPPRGPEDRPGRPDQPARTEKGAYLGLATSPAPRALRHQVDLPTGVGLVVDAVAPDSPAAEAGLKRDDLLHKLNDQILVNPQQLAVLVRTFKAGDTVRLTAIRAGKPTELSAKLVEKELRPLEEMRLGDPFGGGPFGGGPFGGGGPDGPIFRPFFPRPDQPPRGPGGGGGGGGGGVGGGAGVGGAANPFPPGLLMGEESALTWDDGRLQMTITNTKGRRHLLARDKEQNKTLCDGPVDTEEQRSALPPAVREKLQVLDTWLPRAGARPGAAGKPDRPATRPADGVQEGTH